jgi:WD40 repeat protein
MCQRRVILLLLTTLPLAPIANAAGAAQSVSFRRQIAPVLVQKCQACHGPEKAKGGYRLDTFERLMKPGHGDAKPVVPGKPEASELYRLITSHDADERMPQMDEPLAASQVKLIGRWIREGATFDGPEQSVPLSSLVDEAGQLRPEAPKVYPRPVPVLALAFRPDGKELAASGYFEVTVWDPADGRLVRRIGQLPQHVQALAYSPDGALIAAAGGTPGKSGEVRIVRADGSEPPPVLDRIADLMLSVSFSPDGSKLAAGGADGTVRVYDVATGKRDLLIEPHADWATAVAFSPDGTRLASASRDKSARVFDAKTGELHSAYVEKHDEPIYALAWSPDGKRLYTGGRDKAVHVWEPKDVDAKKLGQLTGFAGDVLRLDATAGYLFATCADGKVRQYARDGGATPALVRTLDAHADWVYALAIDTKNNRVATGGYRGEVRIHAIEDGKPVTSFTASPGYNTTNKADAR